MNIPAGILDDRIEFFRDPENGDICHAITGGAAVRVKDLPGPVKLLIWHDIYSRPLILTELIKLRYIGSDEILERYCSCRFGVFDGEADFENGRFNHTEYTPVAMRDIAPENDIIWGPLLVGDQKQLTKREIEVLTLTGQCFLNKEIADRLRISAETVKIHIRQIQLKSGLMNKKDLVRLAHFKNLV